MLMKYLDDLVGIHRAALNWFHPFLARMSQRVMKGECSSSPWDLSYGVLSPFLLNVHLRPLGEIVWQFGVRWHEYADDTQLYLSFSSDPGLMVSVLSECLVAAGDWK